MAGCHQSSPMKHEETIAEVVGAKSASTIASANDATATSHLPGGDAGGGGASSPHGEGHPHREIIAPEVPIAHAVVVEAGEGGRAEGPGELRVIEGGAASAVGKSEVGGGEVGKTKPVQAAQEKDDDDETGVKAGKAAAPGQMKKHPNNLRKLRIERMMSKAELARRANLSVLTIDRIEKGFGCRMDSKRKILEALGLSLADRVRVFGEEE